MLKTQQLNLPLRCLLTHLAVLSMGLMSATTLFVHNFKSHSAPAPARLPGLSAEARSIPSEALSLMPEDIGGAESLRKNAIISSDQGHPGATVALLITAAGVGAFSYWLTRSITNPLQVIEETVQRFNSGDINARIPPSSVPELHRLGLTLNSVANRLQDTEESKRELIGDVTHELITPLTVIRAYLEMMDRKEITLTPEITHQMHEEANRMSRLLTDFSVLSQADSGSPSLQLQIFDPAPLLHHTVANLKTKKWGTSCRLEIDCPDRLPEVFADCDRVQQIVVNLINNAMNYTPEGTATVRAWAAKNRLWVSVTDTGVGIAPGDIPHLFERFWRSKVSRQMQREGSGIGLAIVKRLVEMQGGQIEVESQLTEGSTFQFWLPLANPGSATS